MYRVIASVGDIKLFKFIIIPTEYLGEFENCEYDDILQGYIDLWSYTYNRLTRETDDRVQNHADHIDALPFELRKIYRQQGYWGKTDLFRDRVRFFVNDDIGEEKESYLKRLCNVR